MKYDSREKSGIKKDPIAVKGANRRSLMLGLTVLFKDHIMKGVSAIPSKAATEEVVSKKNPLANLYQSMRTDVIKFKVRGLTAYHQAIKDDSEKKSIWNAWTKQAKSMVKGLNE